MEITILGSSKIIMNHNAPYRNKYQIIGQEICAVCNRFCQVAIAAKNSHKPIFDRKFLFWPIVDFLSMTGLILSGQRLKI